MRPARVTSTVLRLWSALLLAALCVSVPAHAAIWQTHGPSQPVYALAIDPTDPSTVYAGADVGKVFKSTDAGGSWVLANSGVADKTVKALVIDPTDSMTVYAGTDGAGVYKNTNGGTSWSAASVGLASDVRALAINPINPAILYAGVFGGGVYKTVGGGDAWTPVNARLSALNVTALVINPSNPNLLFAATLGGGVFQGVVSTLDGSTSWAAVNDGVFEVLPLQVQSLALAVDPASPTGISVYAGTMGKGVYKTTQLTGNWNSMDIGLTSLDVSAVVIDPVKPSTVYAATASGVFRVTDRDPSWVPMSGGLSNLDMNALAIDPTNPTAVYVAGTGVFVQTQLCSALPLTTCRLSIQSNKSVLTVKDKGNNKKDTVLWKWLKGEALNVTDFGSPLTADNYSLCIYDESGATPQLLLGATAPAGRTCGKNPCWKTPTKKSIKFKNALRTDDGIDTITLTAGAAGKAQTVVSMQGIALKMPHLPLNVPLRAQLQASNGQCWDTHFSTFRKNLSDQFDARSD